MKPTSSVTAKCRVEAEDVQKASLSSTSSISNWLMFPLTFLSKHGILSQMMSGELGRWLSLKPWLTASFYLLNQSAALGLLTIKHCWCGLRMEELLQCFP